MQVSSNGYYYKPERKEEPCVMTEELASRVAMGESPRPTARSSNPGPGRSLAWILVA